jgi:hypothetical protein
MPARGATHSIEHPDLSVARRFRNSVTVVVEQDSFLFGISTQ